MVLAGWLASAIWRRRSSLVSTRGFGVRADVEHLYDVPRVLVSDVRLTGPNAARLALVTPSAEDGTASGDDSVELVFSVEMTESDPGLALLQEWLQRRSVLGIVVTPASQILRLRCLDDLQPLTLRRLDP